ncbi:unnamed protein product [Linum tenue]|uniref:Uncharacterized protein n=1 Tax=Linum tenue TaxID=586396 RepID=A0AAV0J8H2_9ROSI|nr:unnamed protein product [Linum tenue]
MRRQVTSRTESQQKNHLINQKKEWHLLIYKNDTLHHKSLGN